MSQRSDSRRENGLEDTDESLTNGESVSHVWGEKYRPNTLDDVVGQDAIVSNLKSYIDQGTDNNLQNLMFSGRAGIGKTTCATALAKDLYGDSWEEYFLELNASDERGIDVVRDRIKTFARTSFGGQDYRIIFLDEADSLTSDAQSALRRTMEQFTKNTRFILSCNYSSEIIDPIQSRCDVYRFTPIAADAIQERIEEIAEQEDVTITEDGMEALIHTSGGDMRRAVNGLQAVSSTHEKVTRDAVYESVASVRPEIIKELVETSLAGGYYEARDLLRELLNERGLSGGDIIDEIHRQIWEFEIEEETAIDVMDLLGETEYRIRSGSSEKIQLEAFLASLAKN